LDANYDNSGKEEAVLDGRLKTLSPLLLGKGVGRRSFLSAQPCLKATVTRTGCGSRLGVAVCVCGAVGSR
jgi:hypothetical protein